MMKSHFALFGVPIRIDPSFLVLVALYGYFAFLRGEDPHGTEMFLLAFPVVLLSVLAHELGHALSGRAFGLKPFVILHALGGMTQFPPHPLRALSHGRRILITLAGPAVGIVAGVGVFLVLVLGALRATEGEYEHRIVGHGVVGSGVSELR